ncbi:hypothetical protein DFH09DRAFT_1090184 [Mycena vulgaris]|nr:hypothetical protein DFH09DRAFT_1090184 [Mycena vulgaris]
MAPKPWATSVQLAYLGLQMPEYIRRQAQKKLYMFWGPMEEGWFSRFSEHASLGLPLLSDPSAPALTKDQLTALGMAISARKKQLANWYRRERKKIRTGNAGPGKKLSPLAKALAKRTKPVGRRVHQAVEVFQKLHKDEIRAELTAHAQAPDVPEETREEQELAVRMSRSERMHLRGRVVSKLWANASEEERQDVYWEIVREKAALAKARREAEERDGTRGKTTGEQYQEGVDSVDEMFEGAHALLGENTGWVGVLLLAGPTPRMPGGEITVKVICSGKTPAGNTFAESCVDFEKQIVEQFTQFADRVFSASTCRERAINAASEPTSEPMEAPVKPPRPPTADVTVATAPSKPKRVPKPKKSKVPVTSSPAASVSTAVATPPAPTSAVTPGGPPILNPDPAFSFLPNTTSPGSLERLGASLDEEFGAGFLDGLGMSAGLYDPASFSNSSFDDAPPFNDNSSPGGSSFGGESSFSGSSSLGGSSLFGGSSLLSDPFGAGGSQDDATSGTGWGTTSLSSGAFTPSALPPPRPLPRPSYIGAPFHNAAESVGAGSIYVPSALFSAFTKTPTPTMAAPASLRRKATAWASPTKSASVSGPTHAALALSLILSAPVTPPIPAFPGSRPAAMPFIPDAAPFIPATMPSIPAVLPISRPAPTVIPTATSVIPTMTPEIPTTTPVIPAATPTIPSVFPVSRPAARIPVAKAAPANTKKAPPKRGTKRTVADVEGEEEALAPKRRPGRPPKSKLAGTGEEAALGDATNANAAPIPIYSSTNNNCARIAHEDVEKKRVVAEKAAMRAENMRLHNPAGERPLVVVPVPHAMRERKAAKFLDGTLVLLMPKLTRAEAKQRKNVPSEKALLERAGRNVLAPAPPSKKRKTR